MKGASLFRVMNSPLGRTGKAFIDAVQDSQEAVVVLASGLAPCAGCRQMPRLNLTDAYSTWHVHCGYRTRYVIC